MTYADTFRECLERKRLNPAKTAAVIVAEVHADVDALRIELEKLPQFEKKAFALDVVAPAETRTVPTI